MAAPQVYLRAAIMVVASSADARGRTKTGSPWNMKSVLEGARERVL